MDALSEALRSVRMTGAIFFNAEFTAPWSFAAPASDRCAPVLSPGSERLISYHFVTEGRATVRMPREPDLAVEEGEIVVIPHGQAHEFCNGTPKMALDGARALRQHEAGTFASLRWGEGGPATKFVCGFMGCERQAEKLFLSGLPTMLKVKIRGNGTGAWLENSIRHLVSERQADLPGRNILLTKMAEALFIETIRQYIQTLPPDAAGWLAGARDPIAGATLALLHRRPADAWTIDQLAHEIGASRSVLSERFSRFLGESPIHYLARWRMLMAMRLLETTNDSVMNISLAVGYESEAAFGRAFKREFGSPPAAYRRSASTERRTLAEQ